MSLLYIPARPTTYNGLQMRSRLEADFAASMDATGSRWEYEPRVYANALGQYLPDFVVHFRSGPDMFVEVKPTEHHAWLAAERMEIIWSSVPDAELTVWWREGSEWQHISATKKSSWCRMKEPCEECLGYKSERDSYALEVEELTEERDRLVAENDSLVHRIAAIESRASYDGNGKMESVNAVLARLVSNP